MIQYCLKIEIFKYLNELLTKMKEKSIFLEFMGDSPIMRVIDYLMEVNGLDFSITDLARNAKVGRATLYRIWDNVIKNEMIVHTRVIGKAKLFKLNKPKNKKAGRN